MFEKESKEYAIGLTYPKFQDSQIANIVLRDVEGGFQKGAEFGYKLAYEEMDYLNKHWESEEERKANEWHFVKDELPDHNGQFYVALKGQTETFILNYDYDEYDESKMVWLDDDYTNFGNEVYAWHEKLKAPKESE